MPKIQFAEKTMTEDELRNVNVPWPKTEVELVQYIHALVDREHDYGTCVYAMSMAALAAFYYVSSRLGVTGFQASCADMDFLNRTRGYKLGFRIVDYSKLLYPQYLTSEHFPTRAELEIEHREPLRGEAARLLEESPDAHPDVLARWVLLAGRSES